MKNFCLFLIFFIEGFQVSAQADSINKFRFSGVQFGFNLVLSGGYKSLSLNDHQQFIKNDPALYENFNTYHRNGFEGLNFLGGVALRLFAELPGKRNNEISLGLVAGGTLVSQLAYSRSQIEVVDHYIGQQFKDTIYRIRETTDYSSFNISNTVTYIPLGIHRTTNKKRYFWGSVGFELAPGFAKYTYYSYKNRSVREGTFDRSTLESDLYLNYNMKSSRSEGASYNEKLSATGFSGYFSVPLSANLHFSKTRKILRNINLSAQLAPIYMYSKSEYTPATYNAGINGQVGIRLVW